MCLEKGLRRYMVNVMFILARRRKVEAATSE